VGQIVSINSFGCHVTSARWHPLNGSICHVSLMQIYSVCDVTESFKFQTLVEAIESSTVHLQS